MVQPAIRDRLWLWGMKVNVLQETASCGGERFGTSTLTVEQAIRRTGISHVFMAGQLPIDEQTLASMPSARRIICKDSLHRHEGSKWVVDGEKALKNLMAAKALAARDTRIEGFHVDDFSTGSVEAGVGPDHLRSMLHANSVIGPRLPISATIYTMSLDRPELPVLLPYFDQYLVPLWHADQIDAVPGALDRLRGMSGGKPMILCLYLFDFGNGRQIPEALMRRHLDLAERLLLEEQIAGLCFCGTCLMDLDWESNRVLYEWLEREGSQKIGGS